MVALAGEKFRDSFRTRSQNTPDSVRTLPLPLSPGCRRTLKVAVGLGHQDLAMRPEDQQIPPNKLLQQ